MKPDIRDKKSRVLSDSRRTADVYSQGPDIQGTSGTLAGAKPEKKADKTGQARTPPNRHKGDAWGQGAKNRGQRQGEAKGRRGHVSCNARTVKSFITDGGGDSGWTDADDVSGDIVLSQTEWQYDANSNVLFVIGKDRFHDETATGELGDATTAPKARVSYAASYYDKADRLTDAVNVGTNGGSSYTRPGTVPSRSDTVLVNSNTYNDAGWVESTTDPRGIVNKTFYDTLGRVTKTVEAYTDGTPSTNDDKTTEYTYDGMGNMLTLKAYLTSSSYQKTEWVYGVTTASGSTLNSNDLLKEMKYPDKSTGDPSSSEKENYTVNALGEKLTYTDRNGSVHTITFDVLGRPIGDAVTTLGSGIDGAVRRIETAYDTAGRPYLFTSYDAASGGNIVNQVQREFNGLSQLTKEYQSHSGAVNTGTTPKVQYAWSEMASGANHSRLTSMTYPSGYVLTFNYSSGLNSTISRLSSLSDSSGTLEAYDYLGLGTIVRRAHSQPGVDLTYIKQSGESNGDAGDQYTGHDRFGRIEDQRWIKTSSGTHTDRFKYGHDRNSNRLYRENLVDAAFSELYHENGSSNGYDPLNQLTEFQRGTLNSGKDSITGTASRTQEWALDALGNWSSLTTNGTAENRTHNKQNQVTGVGSATLTFDANGNLKTDETGRQFKYDAWNRLVEVKDSGTTVLASHKYDATGHRIQGTIGGVTTDMYYSANWQVLEEREGSLVRARNVWSPVYVNAMVLRDRDTDGNGTLEERLWVQQDANYNVTALVDGSGNVVERYVYDPFGVMTVLDGNFGVRTGGSNYGWVYGFQGMRAVAITGLYEANRRWYSPTQGRWTSLDLLGFASGDVNFYRSEENNPVNRLDPSGLVPIGDCGRCTSGAIPNSATFPKCKPGDEKIPAKVWTVYYAAQGWGSIPHRTVCAEYGGEIHSFSFNNWWVADDPQDKAACKAQYRSDAWAFHTNKCAVLNEFWKRVAEDDQKYNAPFYLCWQAAGYFMDNIQGAPVHAPFPGIIVISK